MPHTTRARSLTALLLLITAGLFLAPAAQAGCHISAGVKNDHDHEITVHVKLFSAVKSRGGSWRAIDKGHWGPHDVSHFGFPLASGKTYKDTYSAAFGCNKSRRYRIAYKCPNGSRITQYYPSSNSWTKETSFVLRLNDC